MKFIFDFDDVLFNNTKQFKPYMYTCLEKAGVPQDVAETYYKEVREKEFSLINFITTLLGRQNIKQIKPENVYKEIMERSKDFINVQLIEFVKKLGKENCFIITNGEYQFNYDKVYGSGVNPLFNKIYIVPGSKKEVIYEICEKYKDEEVVFVDDKTKFIDDIELSKYPNLKTVLFDETSFEKLKNFIK